MPLLETKGAASAQGFGLTLGSSYTPTYIEDVFSTWLFTGNGGTQTITNGIDLSDKGGLVWAKPRTGVALNNQLWDTNRGPLLTLSSDSAGAQYSNNNLTAFLSNGFTLASQANANISGNTSVAWTFRKQAKFFDVVTYTGNGTTQAISHNLGSVPGCIIVKCTSASSTSWAVYHRSVSNAGLLNSTNAFDLSNTQIFGNNTNAVAPTSTQFTVGQQSIVNSDTATYVAYLFAHDAGGFGLTGTDNVISCGSVSGSSTVNLGWEPQWLLVKYTAGAGQDWGIVDNMRGVPTPASGNTPYAAVLNPNLSNAESTSGLTEGPAIFNATGFRLNPDTTVAGTHIYIAIRRGPMKTPTTGTSVYNPTLQNGNGSVTTNFPIDLLISRDGAAGNSTFAIDRLRGFSSTSSTTASWLTTNSTSAENSSTSFISFANNVGFTASFGAGTRILWSFCRAPGFFDVVCYTGTSTGSRAVTHNLGVAPEMVIVKQRTAVGSNRSWWVLTTSGPRLNILNDTSAANAFGVPANLFGDSTYNNYIAPTATTVTLSPSDEVNSSSNSYVMYLFASCPGVSKVGSYTGTGALQTINCGFTGGARFVLIKRTDSTGDWYVYDSARGISSGNDPYLFLNSTAAEVTGTNYVDTTSVGFQVTAAAPADLNANGGTYIFLAIA